MRLDGSCENRADVDPNETDPSRGRPVFSDATIEIVALPCLSSSGVAVIQFVRLLTLHTQSEGTVTEIERVSPFELRSLVGTFARTGLHDVVA